MNNLYFIFSLILVPLIFNIYCLLNPIYNDISFELADKKTENEAALNSELYGINGTQLVEMLNIIENNWIPPKSIFRRYVIIRFNTDKNGYLKMCKVLKSSGNHNFDKSALLALQKTNPLPVASEMQDKYYIKLILTNQNHKLLFDEEGMRYVKYNE